jgi:hypothetical protein
MKKEHYKGRYSIYTGMCSMNMKREKNKRFSIVCIPYGRERDVRVEC